MGLLKLSPAQEAIAAWVDPQTQYVEKEYVANGSLPGLANLGNTCFANSVLQCLLNTPGWLPEACLAFRHFEGSTSKAALGRAFQSLAREYSSMADGALQKSNSSLKNMKDAVAAIDPQYAGCQQQDAYEFLGCLLEGLEEGFGALFCGACSDKCAGPNADVIRAICGVTTLTRRVCHSCSGCFEVDRVTDTAIRLPLLSPSAQFDPVLRDKEENTPISLQELIDAVRQPETIEGYDCDACRAETQNGAEYTRSVITQHASVIAETRDVIVVVLYRFGHALDAAGNFEPVKVKRQVVVPTKFDIESKPYCLYGVVSHLGSSLSAGHYVAAVRSHRDGLWYECNDETVTPLNLKALYDGGAVTSVRPGAEPYILFYHRDSLEAEGIVQDGKDVLADLTGVRAQALELAAELAPPSSANSTISPNECEGNTAGVRAMQCADHRCGESVATHSTETISHTGGETVINSTAKGEAEAGEGSAEEHVGGNAMQAMEMETDGEWILVKSNPTADSTIAEPAAVANSPHTSESVSSSQSDEGEEQRVAPKRKASSPLFQKVVRRGYIILPNDEAADSTPADADGCHDVAYSTEDTSIFNDLSSHQWLY